MSIIAGIISLVKSLFNIELSELPQGAMLAIQAGYKHFAYSLTDKTGSQLYQLQYLGIEDWNEETITSVINLLPNSSSGLNGVELAYDTGDITLMPVAGYEPERLIHIDRSLHPFRDDVIFNAESLAEWQLYIGYRVPALLYRALEKQYPQARVRHQLKLALQQTGSVGMQGKIVLNFRPAQFTLLLIRNNRLQLAQEYNYSQPADVLYYLLKVCQDYSLLQQEVELVITGLLDQESSLFREIWNYFIQVTCREAIWGKQELTCPAHYFTTLNDLSQCAS